MRRTVLVMLLAASATAQDQSPTASEGWVKLPSEGETSAEAFVVVENPGMYDVYLVSAACELAAEVELRDGDGEPEELVVPAYGKLTMKPEGAHMVLVDLKRSLEEGEAVPLTLTTDSSSKLRIDAVVRKK